MIIDPADKFVNSKKAASSKNFTTGLHLGKVVRVTAGKIYVTVPVIAGSAGLGPCIKFTTASISKSDTVLVGFLDFNMSTVVILGKKA